MIVGQYALLKNQYADAVKELQLRTTQMVSMAANASASAPQPVASGSNTPREIRPVPGECSLSHCRLGLLTRRYQWSLYRYRPSVFHFAERSLSMHFSSNVAYRRRSCKLFQCNPTGRSRTLPATPNPLQET